MQWIANNVVKNRAACLLVVVLLSLTPLLSVFALAFLALAALHFDSLSAVAMAAVTVVVGIIVSTWFASSFAAQPFGYFDQLLYALVTFLPAIIFAGVIKTKRLSFSTVLEVIWYICWVVLVFLALTHALPGSEEVTRYLQCLTGCGEGQHVEPVRLPMQQGLGWIVHAIPSLWLAFYFLLHALLLIWAVYYWQRIDKPSEPPLRFAELMLSRETAAVAVATLLSVFFLPKTPLWLAVAVNLSLAILSLFGLIILHQIVHSRQWNVLWLFFVYMSLFFGLDVVYYLLALLVVAFRFSSLRLLLLRKT